MWQLLYILTLSVLFASVASFLTVVGERAVGPAPFTLLGRSHCDSCGRTLRWWQLIPVGGFFLTRGRCPTCRRPVSWFYPLSELAFTLVTWGLVAHGRFDALLPFVVLFTMATADFATTWVPDTFQLVLLLVLLLRAGWLFTPALWIVRLLQAVSFTALLLGLSWQFKGGLGGADIKVCALMTFGFGLTHVARWLLVACLVALVVLLSERFFADKKRPGTAFLPYLALAFPFLL